MACVVYILNNYNTLHGSEEEVPGLRTSRKMANATYCLWIFAHNIFILILLEEVNEMFNFGGTGGSMVPTLLDAVNRNQLIVFLIGKYVYTSFLSFPFSSNADDFSSFISQSNDRHYQFNNKNNLC